MTNNNKINNGNKNALEILIQNPKNSILLNLANSSSSNACQERLQIQSPKNLFYSPKKSEVRTSNFWTPR